jgi:hypothetical protein
MSVIEPTIRLRSLGLALRGHREAVGLTPEEASELLARSASSILRIERGLHHTPVRDVEYFLLKYGITDPTEQRRLYDLSRNGRKKGWWQSYADLLSPGDMDLFGIEEDAEEIENFELILIQGLFQTRDYARNLLYEGPFSTNKEVLERLVEIRMRRQQILTKEAAPNVWAVTSEAALRQEIGGRETMRGQYERLLEVSELKNVTLQVLPYSAGAFRGASGAFKILTLGKPADLRVVTVDSLTGTSYREGDREIDLYAAAFARLRAVAQSESDSRRMIEGLLFDS